MKRQANHRQRFVFIDQARGLAILLMLVGHSLDRFLGEPWRSSAAYDHYTFVRGWSSALFLTVSGFSFVVASLGRVEEYRSLTPRMMGRLRRIGLILFLGVLLQLPAGTLAESLAHADALAWERLFSFNVLQTIGIGLLALHGLLFISRKPAHFERGALALTVALFAMAAVTYRADVDAALPVWARGMANLYHQSRFPLVPFGAFIFLGAYLGARFWKVRGGPREPGPFVLASAGAGLLIAFDIIIRKVVPGLVFPYGMPLPDMAGNTFARAGCAILIISALYFVSLRRVALPGFAFLLSKDALAIYFVHLLVVYGGADAPGLLADRAAAMAPWQVGLWIAGLVISMTAMAVVFGYLREHHLTWFTRARRTVVLGVLLSFLLLPRLSPVGISLCFSSGVVAVLLAARWRAARVAKPVAGGRAEG